ncbi:hypothetical protein HNV08_11095 [Winogradskyella eckloniae]|uniref:hypothetical protein n=1 Tax=Winogradskyella eckloniae TaxID=1089306 RepID=UPI001565B623|nr:hypothetical protein [Winogradskyella eckloniae]NRD20595.1 hypothetical protein [Winogradskyella eckloniae]
MKKRIIIFGTALALFSILFFGLTNMETTNAKDLSVKSNDSIATDSTMNYGPYLKKLPELYYGVDARFEAVKKADIQTATSIYDFLNEDEKNQIEDIKSVNLIVVKDNQLSGFQEYGTTAQLTKAQIKLLRSLDYFNHFTIRTEFKGKNKETGVIEDKFFGPHITIVPEQQATYVDGKQALIAYLKENSLEALNVITDNRLNAIKYSFIISKEGKVKDVKHDAMETGYPSIDKKFKELLQNIPGQWLPAKNSLGEKIEQELVFTFGPSDGC